MSQLVFPGSLPGIKIEVGRQQLYNTRTQTTLSGRELRQTWETYPRYRYTFNIELLRSGASYLEFQKLVGFVSRHAGALDSFLFQDPEDNAVAAHYFGLGDASTTDFQLQRTLVADADLAAAGSRSYWPKFADGYEPVFELNGSPSIFKDTGGGPVLQTITTNYTLPGQGLVHFTAAPAAGALLSWTGGFYRRVRFDVEQIPLDRIVSAFWQAKTVQLITVKPLEQTLIIPTPPVPFEETPAGTINGTTGSDGNATFTLSKTPIAGLPVEGFRNGVKMTQGQDFTVAGVTITALAPNIPITGDSYVFLYWT